MTGSIVQSHPWDCPGGPVIKNSTSNAGRAFQWQELKSLLMKVKEGLKLNIHKTKIMASGPSTLWQIEGETVEIISDFIFGGSRITVDGDCSHEIKRCLLLGRKVMTNLDSILKSRDITFLTKVCLVKAMVFPVVLSDEELILLNCGVQEDS